LLNAIPQPQNVFLATMPSKKIDYLFSLAP